DDGVRRPRRRTEAAEDIGRASDPRVGREARAGDSGDEGQIGADIQMVNLDAIDEERHPTACGDVVVVTGKVRATGVLRDDVPHGADIDNAVRDSLVGLFESTDTGG